MLSRKWRILGGHFGIFLPGFLKIFFSLKEKSKKYFQKFIKKFFAQNSKNFFFLEI
jgi:hypothetical protein